MPTHVALACVLLASAVCLDAERLPLRLFDRSDGLGDDLVLVARQDSSGFLWFGGDASISRFDGSGFLAYGPAEGVPAGWVSDILETRSGELLFATGGGVCWMPAAAGSAREAPRSAGDHFVCTAPLDARAAREMRALHEDRFGTLWVGAAAGLYRGERGPSGWRLEHVPLGSAIDPSSDGGVFDLTEDSGGGLWIATSRGIAHRSPDGRVVQFRVSGAGVDERVFALLLDSRGLLWIGHVDDGVFVWKPPPDLVVPPDWSIAAAASRNAASTPPSGQGGPIRLPQTAGQAIHIGKAQGLREERARTGLLEDGDGAVWIGTVRELGRLQDGRLETFGRRDGLPDDGMRPTLLDRSGNLWLGSPSAGAARLNRRGLTTFDETDGLRGLRIRSILAGRDGALYVLSSAERDFVQRFDGERFEAVAPRLPEGEQYTGWWYGQVGFEDRQGEWWLPTGRDGLLRYPRSPRLAALATGRRPIHYRPRDGLGSDAVQVLYEDRAGDIWIGAFAAPYLAVWRRSTQRFESYSGEEFPRDAPTVFREDASGGLWIGYGDGSLGTLSDGHLTQVDATWRQRWSAVYDLHFDDGGRLWVASIGGGLTRFDEPSSRSAPVRAYTVSDGLSTNDVNCLTEDPRGRIYAGTDKGIDRLDPATGGVQHLTTADGLANNLVRACFRDRRGDLWFGTMQGLSRLRSGPEPSPRTPTPRIVSVEIAGVPAPLSASGAIAVGPLRVPPGADRLRFGFLAPSADLDVEPAYRFRLEGLDSDWSDPTRDRQVTYAGLRPGSYRFAVIAELPDGALGGPATVELTLAPPLWRRWWVLAALGALPLAGAWAFHRQRVARLVAVERVRTRIAADLHDDLGASLSRIAVLSEVANRKAEGTGAVVPELLEIADTARLLTDEASDMVWSIDPRQEDVGSLLLRLRPLAADLLEERGIALEWRVEAGAAAIRLATDQRRHLLLILKEALHNAARHSRARTVELRAVATRHELELEVRDDGQGFDAARPAVAAARGRRGLLNLEARTRQLGGRLSVRSAPGAGTSVELRLPRKRSGALASHRRLDPHQRGVVAPRRRR